MAKYTYIFCDLLTNTVLDELPLYGVYFDVQLNKAGTFTGTCRLDWIPRGSLSRNPGRILAATLPGRTAIYIDRDGVLIWGGIIWTRTYESSGNSIQFYGETFDSYAKVRVNKVTRVFSAVDQRNIVRSAWTIMQSETSGNIGMILPSAFSTDVPRSKTLNGFEQDYWGDVITDLQKMENGFDYFVQVQYDTSGNPSKTLLLGWPRLGVTGSASNLVFEYPGAIQKYWFPENASDAANRLHTTGKGDGAATLQSQWDDVATLTAGYPLIEKQLALKDLETQALLDARTRSEGQKIKVPITTPTVLVYANRDPVFGSYGLGDDAIFVITDLRFPNTLYRTWRIIGWQMTPSSADGPDEVTLVIQGQEND